MLMSSSTANDADAGFLMAYVNVTAYPIINSTEVY